MKCDICGRMLIYGCHWILRTIPPPDYSMLMVRPDMSPPSMPNVYMLCYGCSEDMGVQDQGERLPHNRGVFKHPSMGRKPVDAMQAAQIRQALDRPLHQLIENLKAAQDKTAHLDPLLRLDLACAMFSAGELIHLLGEYFPKEQAK